MRDFYEKFRKNMAKKMEGVTPIDYVMVALALAGVLLQIAQM